ncbi:unnamed protein product [Orchesella dallaii]|uniref:F-box domain-containing protein n=1 Tax=Orchesella dallaii TaxID=48710 RepID=A0ABP1QDA5_9HEXA
MSETKREVSTTLPTAAPTLDNAGEVDEPIMPTMTTSMYLKYNLPPEVLTMILKNVFNGESWKAMLDYRLINSQWKDIINSFLEKTILSGELPVPPFPEFRAVCAKRANEHPTVRYPPSFLEATNPFPFNSLFLTRKYSDVKQEEVEIPMSLPDFVSSFFGGNLTSFAFHDPVISINNLASLLGAMPSLKLFSISDGNPRNFNTSAAALASPPPLPKLTTLVIKSACHASRFVNERRKMLHVWLIGSYADQLVSLSLQTENPLLALQPNHQYYHAIGKNRQILVATTLASAYGKLEELKIYRPNSEFLQLSETPVLKQLSVVGSSGQHHLFDTWGIPNLLRYIEKYKETLEQLYLDVSSGDLFQTEFIRDLFQPRARFTLPHVKTLAFRFPSFPYEYEEMIENTFLVMFPALESLQLLWFQGSANVLEDNPALVIEDDERIAGFANQVAEYNQQMVALQEYSFEERAIRREMIEHELGPAKREAEKYLILHRLMKGERVWNICKELKSLSISSGSKASGNVCVRGRPNN